MRLIRTKVSKQSFILHRYKKTVSHRIQYRTFGEGELVVLVHGYGGSVHQWGQIKDQLQQNYLVVVPNLSHLYMSHDKLLFTVQVTKFAMSLKEKFPGRRVHLVGASYGAAICWALASLHSEVVQSVTLINPMVPNPIQHFIPAELRYFFILPISKKAIYVMLKTPIGKSFLKKVSELFKGEQKDLEIDLEQLSQRKLMFIAHLLGQFAWILRNEDWSHWDKKLVDLYPQIMLIYDKHDTLFSVETYENFSALIEPSKKLVTEQGGHASIALCSEVIASGIAEHILEVISLKKTSSIESA